MDRISRCIARRDAIKRDQNMEDIFFNFLFQVPDDEVDFEPPFDGDQDQDYIEFLRRLEKTEEGRAA
jgi:hypothetical protein